MKESIVCIPLSTLKSALRSDPLKIEQLQGSRNLRAALKQKGGNLDLMSPILEQDIQEIVALA